MPSPRFFKKENSFPIKELAKIGNCTIVGDDTLTLQDIATLESAKAGDVGFLSNPKYLGAFQQSKASVCVLEERFVKLAPEGMTLLVSANSYQSYALIAAAFYPPKKFGYFKAPSATISPSASIHESSYIGENVVISENAEIGANCYVGANTFIDSGVKVGDNTQIRPNCTIAYTVIGKNCIIHAGVRSGQDGFGFAPSAQGITKVEQLGTVVIGNNVEIGANTCIDRGAIEDTIIGDGTKIDNLVQIGHNVKIGQNCFIVSQVGIAGSTVVGNQVMLGGQVGIAGHVSIGDKTMIAAQSGIMSNVDAGSVLGGSPAVGLKQWHRMTAYLKKVTDRSIKTKEDRGDE